MSSADSIENVELTMAMATGIEKNVTHWKIYVDHIITRLVVRSISAKMHRAACRTSLDKDDEVTGD